MAEPETNCVYILNQNTLEYIWEIYTIYLQIKLLYNIFIHKLM